MNDYLRDGDAQQLHVHFRARLGLVDRAVVDILAFLQSQALPGFDDFETEVVVREGLTNAVVHGNKEDPEKFVTFDASVSAGFLTMTFSDEGAGFDWRTKLAVENVDPESTCGRGILLMRSYGYEVSANERGNRVELQRLFS